MITVHEDATATFDIKILGTVTQQIYLGNFKVKCVLSPIETLKSDRLYRELLGSNSEYATTHARNMAFSLAQLQFRVISSPAFWQSKEIGGGDLPDENIIIEVLELALKASEQFKQECLKNAEDLQKQLTERIKSNKIVKEEKPTDEG